MYSLINKWIAKRIKIHVQNSASLKLFLKYIIIVNLFVYLHIRLLSLYSPMVFFPSLSTEMSFSFNRHSEYCRLQNLNKAVNYIWKNNYNKSVSIILFYFLIINKKILQCLKYLPYRNKNLIKYWKLILYLGVLLDSASILTLNKMPKVFHLEF